MDKDNSHSFFDGLLERMAPIIIERRLARRDSMEQIEDFLMLFCWHGPTCAVALRRRQRMGNSIVRLHGSAVRFQ